MKGNAFKDMEVKKLNQDKIHDIVGKIFLTLAKSNFFQGTCFPQILFQTILYLH